MNITHPSGHSITVPDGLNDDELKGVMDDFDNRYNSGEFSKVPKTESFLERAMGGYRSIAGPSLQAAGGALNTAAFGLPGIATDKLAPQGFKDFIKPQGVAESIGRGVGDVGGFMVGGPEQLAAKGVERFLPKGANFLARAARGFGKGAAAMGSLEAPQVMAGNENPLIGAMKSAGGGLLQGSLESAGPPVWGVAKKVPGFIKKIPSRIQDIVQAPQKSSTIGSEIADIEGQIARSEASASAPNMVKKGEQIIGKAYKSVNEEFNSKLSELDKESRNVFAKHSPVAKQRFKKLTNDTYDTYGKILQQGEDEAISKATSEGVDLADTYRQEVIDPVLDTIEKTGAKTPTSEKLRRLFTVKEGLGDSALQKADDAVLNNFNNLSNVEKMKALRSSLYKEGSDDFIQTQFSDLHQKFIGKFSPTVADANKSYGPMKQALRWGSKNIKPFNEHEVKRVADIVQKANQGTLDETTASYLKTLRKGRGPFKGSDITNLKQTHQKVIDSLNKEIESTKSTIDKLGSQNLEDIATVRKGGMQSTLEKQNVLQQSATKKSRIGELKLLKEKVDRDLKTRDDLIRYGIISGLSTLGAGAGVYALSKALHEPR